MNKNQTVEEQDSQKILLLNLIFCYRFKHEYKSYICNHNTEKTQNQGLKRVFYFEGLRKLQNIRKTDVKSLPYHWHQHLWASEYRYTDQGKQCIGETQSKQGENTTIQIIILFIH